MQFFSCLCCGKRFDRTKKVKTEDSPCKKFTLRELHAATNSFNYDNKLGEGRFGSVYWGQLPDGTQIAVKRSKAWSYREAIDFGTDVMTLAGILHKNLSIILGFCVEGKERLIVYEYMPNLSLESHLHGQHSSESLLDWTKRMNIAVTSAQAIAYLHHSATPLMVHGNLKASNVLLDSEFEVRVTNFGYGKLMPEVEEDEANQIIRGENGGYLSPECIESGRESDMGDVYSFGVVLLELVSGKRPIAKINAETKQSIVERVLPLVYERKFSEIVDKRLDRKYVEEELKRVVLVGLMCAQIEPDDRPTMCEVVKMLMNKSEEEMAQLEASLLSNCSNGGEVIEKSSEIIEEEKDHQDKNKDS